MKTKLLAGLLLASSSLFTGKAFAGWGVSFGFGHGGYYAPPARVYVAPPPYYPSYYAAPGPYGYRHAHFVPAHFTYGPYGRCWVPAHWVR